MHADDRFHPPTSDDPFWAETCWFTFAVPERRLSGQRDPLFRSNWRARTGVAHLWDDAGGEPQRVRPVAPDALGPELQAEGRDDWAVGQFFREGSGR
ncbi:MAG: hypothetical protein QF890_17685 [Myxococcota bacterium]|jgi:hypothetical protein|nr:hypothetical protein [Deltaproteobacteria bacterium]MDP6073491.1 hypothetical protein [Myxococcota bacterium]MDP6244231.1 hypothetical protein [Myxococcota bacterium]MDP7076124.1 hypothetical protein [Myxococcota bacterium]MDP7301049.1 hypothetical protein [Myxococcota bacterium]